MWRRDTGETGSWHWVVKLWEPWLLQGLGKEHTQSCYRGRRRGWKRPEGEERGDESMLTEPRLCLEGEHAQEFSLRWGLLGIVVQEEGMDLSFVDNEWLMGLSLSLCLPLSLVGERRP